MNRAARRAAYKQMRAAAKQMAAAGVDQMLEEDQPQTMLHHTFGPGETHIAVMVSLDPEFTEFMTIMMERYLNDDWSDEDGGE